MTECPSCHQQIEIGEQHHGTLFSCPKCQAVFFVGWDGQPEVAEHQNNQSVEIETPASEELQDLLTSEVLNKPVRNFEEIVPVAQEQEAPAMESPISFEAPVEQEAPAYFDTQTADVAPALEQTQTQTVTNFDDVSQFANSDMSVGPLSYTLFIKGIELAHIHEAVKDAITDSRFGWDSSAMLAKIKDGELIIDQLSPAKASILVNRIKSLPVEISWRQDVLTTL